MTKRQLKQIMSLYKGGINYRAALRIAVSLSAPPLVPDSVIDKITNAVIDTMDAIENDCKEVLNDNL